MKKVSIGMYYMIQTRFKTRIEDGLFRTPPPQAWLNPDPRICRLGSNSTSSWSVNDQTVWMVNIWWMMINKSLSVQTYFVEMRVVLSGRMSWLWGLKEICYRIYKCTISECSFWIRGPLQELSLIATLHLDSEGTGRGKSKHREKTHRSFIMHAD
jgi:hypothetical protein